MMHRHRRHAAGLGRAVARAIEDHPRQLGAVQTFAPHAIQQPAAHLRYLLAREDPDLAREARAQDIRRVERRERLARLRDEQDARLLGHDSRVDGKRG
eukprot:10981080-Prorocentrum_lima.AAC.1